MKDDITLEALDAISNVDDTADNSVKKIKDGVKRYSERLNADREKIRTEIDNQYKSKLSKLLGVELKDLTQETIDEAIKIKIEDSDVVKEANKVIEANNAKLVQEALEHDLKDTTTVIIAEKIVSVMNADKILVLDDGKLVAEGTHEELLKTSPIYQDIYRTQKAKEKRGEIDE